MSRNIHLKFRVGSSDWETVSAAATLLETSIERLAKESLVFAAEAIVNRKTGNTGGLILPENGGAHVATPEEEGK